MDGQAPRTADEVRGFFDAWITSSNAGDWDAVATLMHADVVIADPMYGEPAVGRPAALERVREQYAPFPDGAIAMVGDPFVALDEPELAYRWRFTGTHRRRIDPPGFAATGLPVTLDGTSVLRFVDGLVASVTLSFDTTTVARQLLAAPPAGSPLERGIALAQRARVAARRLRRSSS